MLVGLVSWAEDVSEFPVVPSAFSSLARARFSASAARRCAFFLQADAWAASSATFSRASAMLPSAIVASTCLRWYGGRYLSSISGWFFSIFESEIQARSWLMPWKRATFSSCAPT